MTTYTVIAMSPPKANDEAIQRPLLSLRGGISRRSNPESRELDCRAADAARNDGHDFVIARRHQPTKQSRKSVIANRERNVAGRNLKGSSLRGRVSGRSNPEYMQKIPCVYILASRRNGTLYTGVTGNLLKRIFEHKNGLADGFTKTYGVYQLVYYEVCPSMETAIAREKQIKAGSRKKKLTLIEKMNPDWRDLSDEIIG